MEQKTLVCFILFLCFLLSTAKSLITANMFEARGQRVCRVGKGRPCYKLAYFSEPERRLNFGEANVACRSDGGELLSVESATEQQIIEQLVTELRPSDGDFWIGLRRNQGEVDSSADCPYQYYWQDGSHAAFRNWHWDEPSCGNEVCVVMYHQPSAPPGLEGPYMFQWNDDICETKNNFICKYTTEKPPDPFPTVNFTSNPDNALPFDPMDHGETESRTVLSAYYIILPAVPLLLLLLLATIVCCFKLLARRRKKDKRHPEVCPTVPGTCPSPTPTDVYNVIRSQQDTDLAGTRPNIKNTSFLGFSPDTPPGDYDNLGGRDTESGFVTLASTESCFLNFDVNDLSLGRRGNCNLYESSLGRQGKRNSYDTSLGRYAPQDLYSRSLGRRAGRSELYSGSGGYGELYENSLAAVGGELYDPSLGLAGQPAKAELYQTYLTNGKEETYQSSLGRYGSRRSYQSSVDYYGNGSSLAGGSRYFREAQWVDGDGY